MNRQSRVLVVDDEASIRRQLSVGLIQRGFEVEDCEDGLSALQKIESGRRNGLPHNYVVLDLRLPDIDGLKILEVIKSKYPDLPVVVITGYGDEQTKESVDQHLANGYLDKPFRVDDLEAEFRRILPEPEAAAAPRPRTDAEAHRQESAYVFIRGTNDADLEKIYTKLYFGEKVLYCDAVRGDWDIVVLVQAEDRKGIEEMVKKQVHSLKGIGEVEIHYSERPYLGTDLESFISSYERIQMMEKAGEEPMDKRNRRRVSSYAVLEIDRSLLIPLYTKFYFTDNVVYCDATDEGDRIILLLQGQDFDQIRRTVSNEVRTQPGVIRVKTLNIMEIIKM